MAVNPRFTAADYVVFFLTIGLSMSIGIFFAIRERIKKHNTPEHYFLAGRKLRTIPVAISFVVTFQSSIIYIGMPAEGYVYGTILSFYALGYAMATLFAALFIIPVFHPLRLMSVYQYLYIRYGNRYLQMFTLTTGVTYTIFYMGTVTYGTCVALEVVVGMPLWATILIYTIVTAMYTAGGGIKAVVWTDVFQFVVMVMGVVVVLIKATNEVGGAAKVCENAKDRFESIEFGLDPRLRYTVWNLSIGTFTNFLFLTFMQPAMQRIYSTPSSATARNLYLLSIPGFCIVMVLATLEGAVIYAYYVSKQCDVYHAGIVDNINGILPYAVLDIFQDQPGLAGLFIAALSSAVLSTLSSCLSGLSAITYTDIIKVKYPNINAQTATSIAKLLVLFYGIVAMGMAFLCSILPGSIVAAFQALVACLDGPTCAIFLLSVMFRRATTKGLFIGALVGTALPLWINFGRMFSDIPTDPMLPNGTTANCPAMLSENDRYVTNASILIYTNASMATSAENSNYTPSFMDEFYKISFMLWSLLGFLVTTLVGVIVSLFTSPPDVVDERCIFSFKKHVLDELFKKESKQDEFNMTEQKKMLSK